MWTVSNRLSEVFSKLSRPLRYNTSLPSVPSWPLFTRVGQQHIPSEGLQDKEESFGFDPDKLDLAHLDQTNASSAAPTDSTPSRNNKTVAQQLTHLDSQGRAQMVDAGQKQATTRSATASAVVQLNATAFSAIATGGRVAKGDAMTVAQLAGIMGAKQTSQLIPLCHNIPLDKVSVELRLDPVQDCIHIEAMAKTHAYTGVEMEAMMAASIAALTVYDMCKALDKGITIQHIRLENKTGGKSGDYNRSLP